MSTPEIRATCPTSSLTLAGAASTLPLLVAGVLADDDDPPVPADHLALLTDRLDARSNLHVVFLVSYCPPARLCPTPVPTRAVVRRAGSLVAVGDPPSGEVVRCDLHLHLVPGKDPDPVHPHLAGAVGEHA